MSKINALYILIIVIVAVAIFLGVAATNNSSSHTQSQTHAVQRNAECCPDDAVHTTAEEKAWNEVCPVMGGNVNPQIQTVEFSGKHYGFCCPGCIEKFAKEPEKFSANLSGDGKRYK